MRVLTKSGDFTRIPLTTTDQANRKDWTDGSSTAGALLPYCIDCCRFDAGSAIVPFSAAAVGSFVATYFGPDRLVFGACIFVLGLSWAALQADRSVYRFGGVTLAIVLLLPRVESGWLVAFQRFAEVSIGVAVRLVMTVLWPEAVSEKQDRFWRNRRWQQWFELLYRTMMTIAQIRQVPHEGCTPVLESKVLYPCFEDS